MPLGRLLVRFDRVGSTMDVAAFLARQGAGEGTCVVAGYQASGRGRANRSWYTPPGTALLCSVVLRPDLPLHELTPMAILTADAIAGAVEEMTGLQPQIKWPNDVLINGRKVSGVLIQTSSIGGGLVMIAGLGVNANIPADALPGEATSFLRETGSTYDLDDLRTAILHGLDQRYRALLAGASQPFWADIQRKLAMQGELVTVINGGQEITGTLSGIDPDGALRLENSGEVTRITSGDVVRGPRLVQRS